jgi:hypothetical protein
LSPSPTTAPVISCIRIKRITFERLLFSGTSGTVITERMSSFIVPVSDVLFHEEAGLKFYGTALGLSPENYLF